MHFGEAQHGLVRSCLDNGVCPTSFPALPGIGATGNKSLFSAMGNAISDEARGWANAVPGTNLVFWAPNINLHRNILWGRNQETPGEDPTINGVYATMWIAAMQGGTLATDWSNASAPMLKTAATIKHYVAYDVECEIHTHTHTHTTHDTTHTHTHTHNTHTHTHEHTHTTQHTTHTHTHTHNTHTYTRTHTHTHTATFSLFLRGLRLTFTLFDHSHHSYTPPSPILSNSLLVVVRRHLWHPRPIRVQLSCARSRSLSHEGRHSCVGFSRILFGSVCDGV
jgi:hypothetical protein